MTYIIDFCRKYKKVLAWLLSFELLRGLLIVSFAWLLQSAIRFNVVDLSLFIVLALRILIDNFRIKFYIDLSLKVQCNLRQNLHESVFKEIQSGELLNLLFDTIKVFDDLFVVVLPNVMSIFILIPTILFITLILDPMTALIFILTLPIAPFLLYLIGNAVKLKNQIAFAALNKLNSDFKELLSAITTIKIFNQREAAFLKLKSTSQESSIKTLEVLKLTFISAFALELITTLSIAIVAVTAGLRLIDNSIDFDMALFLIILAPEFYLPIRQIGVAFHVIVRCREAVEKIKSLICCNWSIRLW